MIAPRDYNVSRIDNNVEVHKICEVTKEKYSVHIHALEWDRIQSGQELMQRIVPHLSSEQREFLISGKTPAEWKEMFAWMEEEEGGSDD